MNICVTVNSKYKRYLYIMLESLYENNQQSEIRLFVIQRDFTDDDKNEISSLTKRYGNTVEFIWVDEHKYDDMPIYRIGRSNLSLEIYFRLLIPEYLPDEIDRVLMLDVDIVINKDISDLYNIDLEDYYFAAAPNMCHNFLVREEWREWYSKDRINWIHYNTGILMWNLKKIRKDFPREYIFKLAWEIPIKTATFEEEIFNVAFGDKGIKNIPAEKWNYISTHENWFKNPRFHRYKDVEEIKRNCGIIHYAAMNPWQAGVKNESFRLWWDWTAKSPYYEEILRECYEQSERYLIEMQKKIEDQEKKLVYDDAYRQRLIKRLCDKKIKRIEIYGAGRVARCIDNALQQTGIEILCYIDRLYRGIFCGRKTIDFEAIRTYETDADAIIVSTPYYIEEIKKDIRPYTRLDILNLDDLLADEEIDYAKELISGLEK